MIDQTSSQNKDDRIAEAGQLLEQGNAQFNAFDFEAALQSYQQALDIYQEIGDEAGEGSTRNNIGVAYARLNQNELALEFLKQALVIRKEIADQTGEGTSLLNLGWVYDNLNQVEQALEFYQQALAIRKELDDKAGIGDALRGIGAVYEKQARVFYRQTLEVYKEIDDRASIANLICNTSIGNLIKIDDPFYPKKCPENPGGQISNPPTVDPPRRRRTPMAENPGPQLSNQPEVDPPNKKPSN